MTRPRLVVVVRLVGAVLVAAGAFVAARVDAGDVVGVLGFGLLITGIAMLSVPAAFITAGGMLLGGALWRNREFLRRRRS